MEINIIYCYDAYCNWCFAFSSVIKKIENDFGRFLNFEVLSGGLILPKTPTHIAASAAFLLEEYKKVEHSTGSIFGDDYLWHIKNPADSDWYPNSEKPAVALCIFKEYLPDNQVTVATDLQHALFVEGRDLCDDEAYRHLLGQYSIPEKEFYNKLHSLNYKEQAYHDFALVKQLKVTGYPAVLMQTSESKVYLVSNGFTSYEIIAEKIKTLIQQIEPRETRSNQPGSS